MHRFAGVEDLESAESDADLLRRLKASVWLNQRTYAIPLWLCAGEDILGSPNKVRPNRAAQLKGEDRVPKTADERRLVRNRAAIKQINAEFARQPPKDVRGMTASEVSAQEREEAETLRATILAPLFDRINHDASTITGLRQEVAALQATLQQQKQGVKRKLSIETSNPTPNSELACRDLQDEYLTTLADEILEQLRGTAINETIQLCGLAPLHIIVSRPKAVLDLAQQRLHTWSFNEVPTCWRRLYEEASIYTVVEVLQAQASRSTFLHSDEKRRKLVAESASHDWITEVVQLLDRALVISGAPGRKDLIEIIFDALRPFITTDDDVHMSHHRWTIGRPDPLNSQNPISRCDKALNYESFALHLKYSTTPLVIPNAVEDWPARRKWQDLAYLTQMTLGGRRFVPVELGESYTDESWTQKVMSFREFAESYLIPAEPKDVGYLAQHDLFSQIPALKEDITVLDYCWATPSPPTGAAAKTPGLTTTRQLEEPLMNAWLGPKGTKTPLHTDPYHNILCQVVGYKYVRLHAPEETPKLYPQGESEAGIDMSNTSQIGVSQLCPNHIRRVTDLDAVRDTTTRFPLFKDASFTEAILAPGDSLYIPLGYWHYVESLTASFSVSFWWN